MKKYKLALVTPWIPQKTGIAVYEAQLLSYLKEYFVIDIYTSADCSEDENVKAFYPMDSIRNCASEYDLIVYEMGNNELFHKDIFELLENCSSNSLVEMHDLVLVRFFLCSYGSASEKFEAVLNHLYGGEAGNIISQFIKKGFDMREQYPLGDRVVRYAKHAIVHNQWSRNKAGEDCFLIPLATFGNVPKEAQLKERIYAINDKFGLDSELVIGCFGWIGNYKRVSTIVRVVKEVIDKGYQIRFVFWGEISPRFKGVHMIDEAGIGDRLAISGYLEEDDYWAAIQRTDIVVNLRYPSAGESSATLLEEFSAGKPVIISDYAAYREFPDDICIKIASGEDEVREQEELEQALIRLIQSKELREQLGKKAQDYVRREHSPEKVARMYYDVARQIVENKEEGAAEHI